MSFYREHITNHPKIIQFQMLSSSICGLFGVSAFVVIYVCGHWVLLFLGDSAEVLKQPQSFGLG